MLSPADTQLCRFVCPDQHPDDIRSCPSICSVVILQLDSTSSTKGGGKVQVQGWTDSYPSNHYDCCCPNSYHLHWIFLHIFLLPLWVATIQWSIFESHCLRHGLHLCVVLKIHALLAGTLLYEQSYVSLRTASVLVLESTNEMKDKAHSEE